LKKPGLLTEASQMPLVHLEALIATSIVARVDGQRIERFAMHETRGAQARKPGSRAVCTRPDAIDVRYLAPRIARAKSLEQPSAEREQ